MNRRQDVYVHFVWSTFGREPMLNEAVLAWLKQAQANGTRVIVGDPGRTYFPKTARYGKPAFVDLLREVERVFREEPESVDQNRSALMTRLAETARPTGRDRGTNRQIASTAKTRSAIQPRIGKTTA